MPDNRPGLTEGSFFPFCLCRYRSCNFYYCLSPIFRAIRSPHKPLKTAARGADSGTKTLSGMIGNGHLRLYLSQAGQKFFFHPVVIQVRDWCRALDDNDNIRFKPDLVLVKPKHFPDKSFYPVATHSLAHFPAGRYSQAEVTASRNRQDKKDEIPG